MGGDSQEKVAVLSERLDNCKDAIERLTSEMKEHRSIMTTTYVTKEEFKPIKNIVYGFVRLILVAFASGIIYLVIKSGQP